MVLVLLTQEIVGIVQGVLAHFVTGTASTIIGTSDYEWVLTPGQFTLTTKGNYLAGALADVTIYGAMALDWIIQALMNTGGVYNALPLPY